jgi:hypothetical protein
MLSEHDVRAGDNSSEPVDPRQFGVIDLFAVNQRRKLLEKAGLRTRVCRVYA